MITLASLELCYFRLSLTQSCTRHERREPNDSESWAFTCGGEGYVLRDAFVIPIVDPLIQLPTESQHETKVLRLLALWAADALTQGFAVELIKPLFCEVIGQNILRPDAIIETASWRCFFEVLGFSPEQFPTYHALKGVQSTVLATCGPLFSVPAYKLRSDAEWREETHKMMLLLRTLKLPRNIK